MKQLNKYLKRNGHEIVGKNSKDYFSLKTVKPYSIGKPTEIGFGVGVPTYGDWNTDLAPLPGTYVKGNSQWGNFIHTTTGSIMVCIVPFWVKINPSSNGPYYLVKDWDEYKSEDLANSGGYYVLDGFFNGGNIAPIYLDKYLISKKAHGTGYVGASLKNGDPISTHADHNPIADLTSCSGNYYYELINAAHSRDGVNGEINEDSKYFVFSSREMQILAVLSLSIPKDSFFCAWANATTSHFPKGCNSNTLKDTNDSSVLYESDGYSNCGKTGSANQLAKTAHNGQECGVCDLSGPMYMASFDCTCDAVGKSITNIIMGVNTTITCAGHGLSEGDQIMVNSLTGADEIKDRIWTVGSVTDEDTFVIDVDSSGFVAYTSGGSVTHGTFRGLKRSANPCNITPGTSLPTDLFNPACALTEEMDVQFRTDYPNNSFSLKLGDGAGVVFDASKKRFSYGFAESTGVSPSGTSEMGNDYFYQYIRNQLVVRLSGDWGSSSYTGVGYRNFSLTRTYSSSSVGGRFACHGLAV